MAGSTRDTRSRSPGNDPPLWSVHKSLLLTDDITPMKTVAIRSTRAVSKSLLSETSSKCVSAVAWARNHRYRTAFSRWTWSERCDSPRRMLVDRATDEALEHDLVGILHLLEHDAGQPASSWISRNIQTPCGTPSWRQTGSRNFGRIRSVRLESFHYHLDEGMANGDRIAPLIIDQETPSTM